MSVEALLPFIGGLSGFFLSSVLFKRPKAERLLHVADEIPIIGVENDSLVLTDTGGAFKVVELSGMITAGKKEDQLEAALTRRFSFFLHLQELPVEIRIISRRSASPIKQKKAGTNVILNEITNRWEGRLERSFETRHYLIISVLKSAQKKFIEDVLSSIDSFLPDLEPRLLRKDGVSGSSLYDFLAGFYNGEFQKVSASATLPFCLAQSRIKIDPAGRIIFDNDKNQYVRLFFGVNNLPETISPVLIEKILSLPFSVTSYLHLKPFSKEKALAVLKYRRKQSEMGRLEMNWFTTEEMQSAGNLVEADKEAFFETELFFSITLPLEETIEETVSIACQQILSAAGTYSVRLVREEQLAQYVFWSQLPGRDEFLRSLYLFSNNLADLTPLSRSSAGLARCDWGDQPICYFPSAPTGNPFGFTFHATAEDQSSAHCVIYAPTGQGKTVLLLHLVGQALAAYPDLSVYMFDRDNGCTVFTNFMNGIYHYLDYDSDVSLNPFDCEDTAIADLQTFMGIITQAETDEDYDDIVNFVTEMLRMPREDRRMNRYFDELARTGRFKNALKKWVDPNSSLSVLFNGTKDTLDITQNRLNVFGLDNVKDDDVAGAALFFHIFKKIERNASAGKPSLVIIDEASTLLKSVSLCREIEKLLKTARKQRMSVVLAFQEVAAVKNSPIEATIRVNCLTNLFWPGTAKTAAELDGYALSEGEVSFILNETPIINGANRPVLLNRPNDSAFLDTDLSCLKEYLSIYKGGAVPVARMNTFKVDYGDDWKSAYLRGERK